MTPSPTRAGNVALIGRPNVGKSTLLNRVLGEKVAAVSPKPQTTRTRVAGIWTDTKLGAQAVFLDTPGLHTPRPGSPLNEAMVRAALESLEDADFALLVFDAAELGAYLRRGLPALEERDHAIVTRLRAMDLPFLVVLNKIDTLPPEACDLVVGALLEGLSPAPTLLRISALSGHGVEALLHEIAARLPEGEFPFPEDQLVDGTERSIVAELIREKIMNLTRQELPYATAVEIERFDESQREAAEPLVTIHARVLVERDSQKGILIGKRGAMLREIGTQARQDIERLLGARVYLDLHVVVERDWTRNSRILRDLGLE
jgi:GTP-binding protein Era